jgi:hypothetical protein
MVAPRFITAFAALVAIGSWVVITMLGGLLV